MTFSLLSNLTAKIKLGEVPMKVMVLKTAEGQLAGVGLFPESFAEVKLLDALQSCKPTLEIEGSSSASNEFGVERVFVSLVPDDIEVEQGCRYVEYDSESGETYRCGLAKHSPKAKHGAWVRV